MPRYKEPKYVERTEKMTLPLIALKGIVAFPAATLSFEISDEAYIHAAEAAFETSSLVFLCTIRSPEAQKITKDSVFEVGTLAKIKQSIKTKEGNMRITAEGYARAALDQIHEFADYMCAEVTCRTVSLADKPDVETQAYCRTLLTEAKNLTEILPSASEDMLQAAADIQNPALLADFIASNLLVKYTDKQIILECFEPIDRIMRLILIIHEETEILECEMQIHKQVHANLNQAQKEHYLREQMRVISEELGDGEEEAALLKKILALECSSEVRLKIMEESAKLKKLPYGSSEAAIVRSHIDTCLEIPWEAKTEDRIDVAEARRILDEDHDGLTNVKERILEYLAVKQLNPDLRHQIICLVGPPGVGKTSVGASIARAMNRKYVRVSLGGVRDEADIRGHRKTYIGSMPGRIINALTQAKVCNPLMLLDEVDKLTRDSHGDPASALLEVLDAEQNFSFRDHFVELPVDLSNCLFIATANTLDTVPKPLLDRMEIIEINSYTKEEKLSIAKNHLIPKQLKRHGMTKTKLSIAQTAVGEIIDFYTKEAGVRGLEREIAALIRRAAMKFAENPELKKISIKPQNVAEYLGPHKILPEKCSEQNEVGVVNGLAYTQAGGDVLKVEVAILDGTGKLELTGSLGDVMKESARLALSLARSLADEYGIEHDFYKTKDIHIHFPEGATPKDGPSAGVSILTALISALTGRAVKKDIAMTGEISLRGRVLPIGGLREKTAAAYAFGIKQVLLPISNANNLKDVDQKVKEGLTFIPCETVSDVLGHALCPRA